MKRELIQNVKAIPYTIGDVIDRGGYLSAVFALVVNSGSSVKITISHSNTEDGNFTEVSDSCLVVGDSAEIPVQATAAVNFDLDLLGCKRYIKVNVEVSGGETGNCAIVLGDAAETPI